MFIHRLFDKLKFLILLFIFFLIFNIFPSFSDNLIVKSTTDNVKVIDKYGNNFLLKRNYILKNGDFFKNTIGTSVIILNKLKLCLNNSIKFKIKRNLTQTNHIIIEHLKGSLFVKKNKEKLDVKLKILSNHISNFKNSIYLNFFNKKSFIVYSFTDTYFKNLYENNYKKLKKNVSYIFDGNIKRIKITNLLNDPLINQCEETNRLKLDRQKKFICKSKFSKFICGFY